MLIKESNTVTMNMNTINIMDTIEKDTDILISIVIDKSS